MRRGLTMVEIVIYIAGLAVMTLVVTGAIRFIVSDFSSTDYAKSAFTFGNIAMERMGEIVRNQAVSIDFDESAFATSSGQLIFNASTTTGAVIKRQISKSPAGDLMICTPHGCPAEDTLLSTTWARVSSLRFDPLISSSSEGVRVTMTIESGKSDMKRYYTLYNTIMVRDSYIGK